jgi:hypothetical protein
MGRRKLRRMSAPARLPAVAFPTVLLVGLLISATESALEPAVPLNCQNWVHSRSFRVRTRNEELVAERIEL